MERQNCERKWLVTDILHTWYWWCRCCRLASVLLLGSTKHSISRNHSLSSTQLHDILNKNMLRGCWWTETCLMATFDWNLYWRSLSRSRWESYRRISDGWLWMTYTTLLVVLRKTIFNSCLVVMMVAILSDIPGANDNSAIDACQSLTDSLYLITPPRVNQSIMMLS